MGTKEMERALRIYPRAKFKYHLGFSLRFGLVILSKKKKIPANFHSLNANGFHENVI